MTGIITEIPLSDSCYIILILSAESNIKETADYMDNYAAVQAI